MEKKEDGEVDDVDDMLNALEVGKPRERARRAPDITPAPEAIAKAQLDSKPARKPFAGTLPMPGAPRNPKNAALGSNPSIDSQIATNPLEHAFLKKQEELPPKRRRNDPTMFTGPRAEKNEPEPTASYVKATAIGFLVVLAAGLIAWRVMGYIAAQAPAHVDQNDPPIVVSTNANASGNPRIAIPPTSPAQTAPVVTDSTANAVAPTNANSSVNQAPNAIATTHSTTEPHASSAKTAPSGASSNGKNPQSKYGGMIDPTAP